jgi:restriction system protein
MKRYYRVMLGRKSIYAEQCFAGNFIGADIGINEDLTPSLPEEWKEFNGKYIPIFLKINPEFSKIGAGLACGFLWTVAKGLNKGDLVLCPDGSGIYHVAEITGDYSYIPGQILPHRRSAQWLSQTIDRTAMTDELWNSIRAGGMISEITRYQNEINKLINTNPAIISNDPTVEDPVAFAMEKHLEDFLVQNWAQTELSKEYNIYEEEGEQVGQQYPTDTGPIDILAISKDKQKLLVIELKKGRASDVVVGQVLRYMGYVQDELAETGQSVFGIIIALNDDQRLRRALAVVPSIKFYRYLINFRLLKS